MPPLMAVSTSYFTMSYLLSNAFPIPTIMHSMGNSKSFPIDVIEFEDYYIILVAIDARVVGEIFVNSLTVS